MPLVLSSFCSDIGLPVSYGNIPNIIPSQFTLRSVVEETALNTMLDARELVKKVIFSY